MLVLHLLVLFVSLFWSRYKHSERGLDGKGIAIIRVSDFHRLRFVETKTELSLSISLSKFLEL